MAWFLTYVSIGLAFYAWLLSYRFGGVGVTMKRVGAPAPQAWLIMVLLAIGYAFFWPLAAPLSFLYKPRRS